MLSSSSDWSNAGLTTELSLFGTTVTFSRLDSPLAARLCVADTIAFCLLASLFVCDGLSRCSEGVEADRSFVL